MSKTYSHSLPLSSFCPCKEVIQLTDYDRFMNFSTHCRERADYYRERYIKSHNEDFLNIELSLRALSSRAIVAAQDTVGLVDTSLLEPVTDEEAAAETKDLLKPAGQCAGCD